MATPEKCMKTHEILFVGPLCIDTATCSSFMGISDIFMFILGHPNHHLLLSFFCFEDILGKESTTLINSN